jgi:hypothetical protein
MWQLICTLILTIGIIHIQETSCTITSMNRMTLQPGVYTLQRHVFITKEDSVQSLFFFLMPSREPRVKFDLSVGDAILNSNTGGGTLHVALLHSEDFPRLGKVVNSGSSRWQFCRDGKLYFLNGSSDNGFQNRYLYDKISVKAKEQDVPYHQQFDITKSGVYYLLITNCDKNALILSGSVTFINPYGQLDAEQFGYLPFYAICCLFYLIMSAVWVMWHMNYCISKRTEGIQYGSNEIVLPIQIWTSAVLVLSMIECIAWYIHYYEWNYSLTSSSYSQNFLYSLALILTIARRTLCRVLIIFVAMGYGGWVKAQISDNRRLLLASFFCLYFSASCLAEVAKMMAFRMQLIQPGTVALLELPVNILEATFIVWVWVELRGLITQLRYRKQIAKLRMYRKFKWILVLYMLVGIIWSLYEMWIIVLEPSLAEQRAWNQAANKPADMEIIKNTNFAGYMRDKRWATNWTLSAFWTLLYMLILASFMYLWRPHNNNEVFEVTQVNINEKEDIYWDAIAETGESNVLERESLIHHDRQQHKEKKKKKEKFKITDEDLDKELQDMDDEDGENVIVKNE